jgi:hypothetical protein
MEENFFFSSLMVVKYKLECLFLEKNSLTWSNIWGGGGKARSPPKRGVTERCKALVGSGLTFKCWNRLERVNNDKRSSLFGLFVSDEEKMLNFVNGKKLFFIVTDDSEI